MYDRLANYYDGIMSDDYYNHYAVFIKQISRDNKIKTPLILDVACGTGRLIKRLRSCSSLIEGVDPSEKMLKIARKNNHGIKFYRQGFLNLKTGKKYDLILSTFDSINYLTDSNDLREALRRIFRHLVSGGLFIFDFNTIYKKLGKKSYKNDLVYHNKIKNNYWYLILDIGIHGKIYKEYHKERFYSFSKITSVLKKNGFSIISVYSAFNKRIKRMNRVSRLFIVAKKS